MGTKFLKQQPMINKKQTIENILIYMKSLFGKVQNNWRIIDEYNVQMSQPGTILEYSSNLCPSFAMDNTMNSVHTCQFIIRFSIIELKWSKNNNLQLPPLSFLCCQISNDFSLHHRKNWRDRS